MTTTFSKEHPEYARIAEQIERAHAERALVIGEAIGNGLVAIARAIRGWRLPAAPSVRKPA